MGKKSNLPINYTSRDFETIKQDLVDHAKRYYPDTFQDFNEAGFGSLMLDTVAYVGDILSFYVDYQANESFIDTASEFDNLVKLGNQTGFKLQSNPASHGTATFFVMVPANSAGTAPDLRYIPVLKKTTALTSTSGARFTLDEDVNFANGDTVVARTNPTNGAATHFAIKNYGTVSSGELRTSNLTIGAYEKFREENIADASITNIVSVQDADGNDYYEVDYLTQNIVMRSIANRDTTTQSTVREILKPLVAPRRFTTQRTDAGMKLQFGSGKEEDSNERVLDPSSVAVKMYGKEYISDVELDPSKLLSSDSLGVSPSNTSLTVVYRRNTKEDTNISTNSLTTVDTPILEFTDIATLDPTEVQSVRASVESTNESPIVGSIEDNNVEVLRKRVQNSFANQRRAVTLKDYETLAYSMPYKFGALKRVKAIKNPNPRRGNLNIATIAIDSNSKLVAPNSILKENLKTWLDKGRMVNDTVEIVDAKIINLGIDFTVIGDLNKDSSVILQNCILKLTDHFNTKADIGEAFYITDVYKALKDVEGVIDVVDVKVTTKSGANYSSTSFNITDNLSTDGRAINIPRNAIYEIKFPNADIKGAVR
jgi:phage-related baseplate assembly protein